MTIAGVPKESKKAQTICWLINIYSDKTQIALLFLDINLILLVYKQKISFKMVILNILLVKY